MHLNDKLAEYVYEELPPLEMTEARRHVATCTECKTRVEDFEQIHHALKAMPDLDPPRRVVIPAARETRPARVLAPMRWLAPIGVAAALLFSLAVAGPIHADWHDSQLTIAFGKLPTASTPAPVATSPAPAIQPVDYQRIIDAVRAEQQADLARELSGLEKRVYASQKQLADLERFRQASMKNTDDTNWGLQQLVMAVKPRPLGE